MKKGSIYNKDMILIDHNGNYTHIGSFVEVNVPNYQTVYNNNYDEEPRRGPIIGYDKYIGELDIRLKAGIGINVNEHIKMDGTRTDESGYFKQIKPYKWKWYKL